MTADVRVDDVSCIFRHRTGAVVEGLRDVSFEVPTGEWVCMVGRSGHGKTTLLRVLAGLQPPTSGEVWVGGKRVTRPGVDRGMVFQQDTIFPWMNVRDNVEFGLRARRTAKKVRNAESDRWLKEVGLEQFSDSWPRELSGGMRKRVALAALLAAGSNIWLMDEPFGSLDYFTRRALQELVLRLWQETRRTVFFVTHDIEEALVLADRILLLREGRLVSDLIVDLPRPRTEEVRASPEAVDLFKAILTDLGVSDSRLPGAAGAEAERR